MRRVWLILAVCVLVVVGATVSVTAGWWGSDAGASRSSFAARAGLILGDWRRTAAAAGYDQRLTLLNSPLVRPASGFRDDQAERKLIQGSYVSVGILSQETPPAGLVRYSNGATLPVPLLSAIDAYPKIGDGRVGNCSPGYCLRVTNARLDS